MPTDVEAPTKVETPPEEFLGDLGDEARASHDAVYALVESWRKPTEASLFETMLAQPVKLSTEIDKLKQLLIDNKFYERFEYNYDCGGWVLKPVIGVTQ